MFNSFIRNIEQDLRIDGKPKFFRGFNVEQLTSLDYDFDSRAVSFANIRRIIGSFKYGHPRRLGFELLALTGMRESVMVDLGLHNFDANIITFRYVKDHTDKPKVHAPTQ